MHNAPSVSYPVGRSRFCGVLLAALWLAGAALVGAWCWQQAMRPGNLRWDGQVWLWHAAGLADGAEAEPVVLRAHLDFQRHLLISLRQSSGSVAWCWLESAQMPQRWADLRRAVYSPARSQAVLDDAPEPSVKPAAPASPET
jgi:toxin CptA